MLFYLGEWALNTNAKPGKKENTAGNDGIANHGLLP
jgi:hypothetical protein